MKLIEAAKHLNIDPELLIRFLNELKRWESMDNEEEGVIKDDYPWFRQNSRIDEGFYDNEDIFYEGVSVWTEDDDIPSGEMEYLENNCILTFDHNYIPDSDNDPFVGPDSIIDAVCYIRCLDNPNDMAGVLLILSILTKNLAKLYERNLPDIVYKYILDSILILQGKLMEDKLDEPIERYINNVADILKDPLFSHYCEKKNSNTKYSDRCFVAKECIEYSRAHNIEISLNGCIDLVINDVRSIFIGVAEERKDKLLGMLDVVPIIKLWKTIPQSAIESRKLLERKFDKQGFIIKKLDLEFNLEDIYSRLLYENSHGYDDFEKDIRWRKMLKTLPLRHLKEIIEREPVFQKYRELLSFEDYVEVALLFHYICFWHGEYDVDTFNPIVPQPKWSIKKELTDKIGEVLNIDCDYVSDSYMYNLAEPVVDLCLAIFHYLNLLNAKKYHNSLYLNACRIDGFKLDETQWQIALNLDPKAKELWEKSLKIDTIERGSFKYFDSLIDSISLFEIRDAITNKNLFGSVSNFMSDALIQIAIKLAPSVKAKFPIYALAKKMLETNSKQFFINSKCSFKSLEECLEEIIIYFHHLLEFDGSSEAYKLVFPPFVKNAIKDVDDRLQSLFELFNGPLANDEDYDYYQYASLYRKYLRLYALHFSDEIESLEQYSNVTDPILYTCIEVPDEEVVDDTIHLEINDPNEEQNKILDNIRDLANDDSPVQENIILKDQTQEPNKSKAGRKKKFWVSTRYPHIISAADPEAIAKRKIEKIWDSIEAKLYALDFPDNCKKKTRKEQTLNALGASLIYYAALIEGIANPTKGKDGDTEVYSTSFSETVKFISSKSTVRPYWVMISDWYEEVLKVKSRPNAVRNLYEGWKKINSKCADILYFNYIKFPNLIEEIGQLLKEEFSKP